MYDYGDYVSRSGLGGCLFRAVQRLFIALSGFQHGGTLAQTKACVAHSMEAWAGLLQALVRSCIVIARYPFMLSHLSHCPSFFCFFFLISFLFFFPRRMMMGMGTGITMITTRMGMARMTTMSTGMVSSCCKPASRPWLLQQIGTWLAL